MINQKYVSKARIYFLSFSISLFTYLKTFCCQHYAFCISFFRNWLVSCILITTFPKQSENDFVINYSLFYLKVGYLYLELVNAQSTINSSRKFYLRHSCNVLVFGKKQSLLLLHYVQANRADKTILKINYVRHLSLIIRVARGNSWSNISNI